LVVVAARADISVDRHPAELSILLLLTVAAELVPITVTRHGQVHELTTSTTFSFAVMLSWGFAPALLAQAAGSLSTDLLRRKPLWKTLFNAAQYTLSLGSAALVLGVTTSWSAGPAAIIDRDLPRIIAAIGVLFVVNNILIGLAMGSASRARLLDHLKGELSLFGATDVMFLLLSPVVIVLADVSYLFVLLILVPIVTISAISLQNSKLIERLYQQAERSAYQALHDPLTDLPNRTLIRDRVDQAIRAAEREGASVAVMVMDLDSFKEVNDSLGHHNGDRLLRATAGRLKGALRASDTIARLGGDEFAVLLPQLTEHEDAEQAAEKILAALEVPFLLEGLTLEIGASIGIAIYPSDGDDADTLFQRADVAMYAAKEHRAGHELYTREKDHYDPTRLTLVAELRRALDHEELELHYQPQANLRTGRIRGAEALIRWRHPKQGMIYPDQFIPLAEHTGLIRPLTSYVLAKALEQARSWHQEGWGLYVSVNLSAQSLLDLNFPDEVGALLEEWDVPAQWLKLELTESSIMADPVRALRVLTRLSAMRLSLAIDDFGTGYSSFAYLKRLPVDTIKIDKSFVLGMATEENDEVIVRSLIDLGRNLGVETVAEGVETPEAWELLARSGCHTAQGYLLSRPVPPGRLTALLEDHARGRGVRFAPAGR
jgi:diguanylate cyclase (GGDEF)-like protein